MNQLTLGKLSPLCQSMISNIINNKYHNKLSQEKCREFGEWYLNYKKQSNEFTELDKAPKDSRLTFHPVYEIPLLRNWFNTNKKPSEEKLESFCVQLNSGHVRHERPPVTTTRLKVWWKNERQKEQRILKEREEISEPVQKKSKIHRTTRSFTKGSKAKEVFESNIGLQASGNAPLSSEIPASLTLCDVKDVKDDVNNDVFITPSESGPKLNTCNIDSCDTQNMLHSACNDASILHNDGNLANLEMAPSSSDFFTSGCEHHHAS
ncbi:hypothetical protein SNE40_021802 [Patella caerulea]|uniref:Homeobox domain-containing protein n=1 Tax=Patella caerulea TaxID=87958 RepID=A0AAN8GBT6_PATCE